MKKIILILTCIFAIAALFLIYTKNNNSTVQTNNLKITTSFYPYYFFAKEITGNMANVINITPSGAEPHDYEPNPNDIIEIENSKLLILNGSVEPWANKIKADLANKNTAILNAGTGLFINNDPHIWLSPSLAKTQVKNISNEIVKIDPQNKNYYDSNTDKLLLDLNKLDSDYKKGLSQCKLKDIVTSHAAFSYLAKDYGLNQVAIAGLSPDSEPSLQQLTQITNFVRDNNIKYIFFESLVSPKLAQTIADETGAKTLVLNPLEGLTPNEVNQGKNYLSIMEDNLNNLKIALQCL